jgi:negative regulator of flagellin synthesis FlgM
MWATAQMFQFVAIGCNSLKAPLDKAERDATPDRSGSEGGAGLSFYIAPPIKGSTSSGRHIVKIDSNSNTTLAALHEGSQRASQAGANGTTGAASVTQQSGTTGAQQSTVSLSPLSTDLRASNASDIDQAKVASIKAALNDGSLKFDSGKIADGMLGTARDLLQTRTPPTGG